jgi:hypothetical protein
MTLRTRLRRGSALSIFCRTWSRLTRIRVVSSRARASAERTCSSISAISPKSSPSPRWAKR